MTITLIHTGGTLGMSPVGDPASLAPGPSLAGVLEQVPELRQVAGLELEVAWNQDSSANEPDDILRLAALIRAKAERSSGFVVIHGTDTMAYTASLLGFLLADLGKPVVLTGSQRPLAYVRSDARGNLVDAVTLAARGVAEVGVCFGDHWLRGVAVDKVSVHQFEAFQTPNLPPLAELGLHIQVHPHAGVFPRQVPPGLGARLESALAVYTPFPGMPWTLPPAGTKGVLIQAYGAGNLPVGRADLKALLAHCRELGLPVVVTTQCLTGGVDLTSYDLGRQAEAAGAISGGRHTRWAALAKLALVLGAGGDAAAVRAAFASAWAGEPL